ncbi:DUF924 domain-containing protein [Craterilacuibacter sinensis]|uniref:Uncharacterized protein n=1 Tax=Craterilacuibacter sinensis TaxID=2686017 RepID=A0A845BPG9_9NEIS|nr:hypothetical protein [Craterilacuibacter sinensis]
MKNQDSLLIFWFGESGDDSLTTTTQAALWSDTDAAIRQRFAPLLPAARKGKRVRGLLDKALQMRRQALQR